MAPNSTPPRLVNSQLVSLPPVGILNLLCLICIVFVCNAHLIIFTWNLRGINVNYYYSTFHSLSTDTQLAIGSPKMTRVRNIFRKAPEKIISNLNIFFSFTEIRLDHLSQNIPPPSKKNVIIFLSFL